MMKRGTLSHEIAKHPFCPSDRWSQTCGVREVLPIHNSNGETTINNTNIQFLDFIEGQIQKQALVQAHNAKVSLDDIYKDNLHFIGMTFRNSMTRSTMNSTNPFDPYFDQFKEIYLKICRRVLGKRFTRKQRLQPLIFAFIDDEGTRNHVPIRYPFQNLHLHVVMLLPYWDFNQQNLFQEIIDDERLFSTWNPNITSFDIRNYDPAKQTVSGMISYAAKGYLQSQHLERQFGSMWQRYPDAKTSKFMRRSEIIRLDVLARNRIEGLRHMEETFEFLSRPDRGRSQFNRKGRGGDFFQQ